MKCPSFYDTLLHRSKNGRDYEEGTDMTGRNLVNITTTTSKEERKSLKLLALEQDISVSALIWQWLREHQET